MHQNKIRTDVVKDALLIGFLIGLDVAARLLPHPPGFSPIAASGLFAGRMLHLPALAIIVPVLGMILSDMALPGEDWRIQAVGFAAMALPALGGIATRQHASVLTTASVVILSSILFFLLSNGAVWAFSGLYPLDLSGLATCYIAALPFLEKAMLGDLVWTAVLFGSAWVLRRGGPLLVQRPLF